MLRKVPLIVILGSTGTGKTKLSLELAERFGGEIISADSMQVYANLDIVTAKASREEQARARHHLLDVATPAEPFTVLHFRNAALPIIDQLLAQSKSPIVVGGTNYYIESLLWETLVSPAVPAGDRTPPPPPPGEVGLTEAAMDAMPAALLHQHLQAVDPGSARRIHPNNKRKIVRAIEVFQQSGQTLSALLEQQRRRPGANRLGGPLRYPHTVLFWLRCQQDVLNERLDRRVDGMLEQGLLREVRAFHAQHMGGARDSSAYTKGVLQTIGFKEFLPYLERFDAANDRRIEEYLRLNGFRLPPRGGRPGPEPTETGPALPPGLDVLGACLDELKLVTRRYSRKQIKWINNRFLASPDRQVPDLYELDTSDVAAWDERVLGRAAAVVESYRRGATCEVEPMPRRRHPGAGLEEETSNFCAVCERTFVGEFQWQLHLRSNKHKRRKEGQRKRARLEGAQGGPEGVKKERKEGNNESEGAQEDSGGVEKDPEVGKEEPEVAPEADSRP